MVTKVNNEFLDIFELAKNIFPLNRSLTGNGVRDTLELIKDLIPEVNVYEVASGTKAFDWTIPQEWNIESAYLEGPDGRKICDYKQNNLHLVGYSEPVSKLMTLSELQPHLHSLPDQPNAIPYVTSYYGNTWGFCITEIERSKMVDGVYKVHIKGSKVKGSLTYADVVLKGKSTKEVLFSTYICHPSMANNETSGICVLTFLAKWVAGLSNRFYTYRFVFIPETIGSIYYLSRHLKHLKKNVVAGFNVTCIGDERCFSFLPSRNGNTVSDRVSMHVLKKMDPNYKTYKWSNRGSDERQYCAPGVDLPIASIMRSKYGEYPEYHTSLDTLGAVVTRNGLLGGLNALKESVMCLESNYFPLIKTIGEPQLSKRKLYPKTSIKSNQELARIYLDLTTWSDGTKSLLDIAENMGVYMLEILPHLMILEENKLVTLNRMPVK